MKFSLLLCCFIWNSAMASPIRYIHYHFENGSPLYYEIQEDGSALISLLYDHERDSPNRAAGHWHFQVFATKGEKVKIILQNFNNVWNAKLSTPLVGKTTCYLSVDGIEWTVTGTLHTPDNRLEIEFVMPDDSVYIARLEPYRLSDYNRLLERISDHPLVKITEIGNTVENRPVKMVRIGHLNAMNHILIRSRSHPWEPGGCWVIEGLVKKLLQDDPLSQKYFDRYCVHILPMTNKDGVVHGRTRFNLQGMDLNRNWDKRADPFHSPENAALENWLEEHIRLGFKPDLAIDIHNDAGGRLHISRQDVNLNNYLSNMKRLEDMLRKYSWFTEGSTGGSFRNPGTFGEGLLERYGIDAVVLELNANWIAGLDKEPFGKDWILMGEQLCDVFYYYFSVTN